MDNGITWTTHGQVDTKSVKPQVNPWTTVMDNMDNPHMDIWTHP
jgi:hypothetical protein